MRLGKYMSHKTKLQGMCLFNTNYLWRGYRGHVKLYISHAWIWAVAGQQTGWPGTSAINPSIRVFGNVGTCAERLRCASSRPNAASFALCKRFVLMPFAQELATDHVVQLPTTAPWDRRRTRRLHKSGLPPRAVWTLGSPTNLSPVKTALAEEARRMI